MRREIHIRSRCRAAAAGAVLLAALGTSISPALAEGVASDREVVAVLDGQPIFRGEVAPAIGFQVYKLEAQIHQLLVSEVESVVDGRLLAREASRRGLEVEALLRLEVEAKVAPVSSDQVEAYLEEHPAESVGPSEARERVALYLREVRRIERRQELLSELRAASRFEVRLAAPRPPRVRLETAGAPGRGPADAPVEVVLFGGFDPASLRALQYLKRLADELPGRVRWVYQPYLRMYDELGLTAATLALAAQEQGRFWEAHDRLVGLGGHLRGEDLERLSRELGVSAPEGGEAAPRRLLHLHQQLSRAERLGVDHPGVMFVNGRYFSATFPYRDLRQLVIEERANGEPAAEAAASPSNSNEPRAPEEPVSDGESP